MYVLHKVVNSVPKNPEKNVIWGSGDEMDSEIGTSPVWLWPISRAKFVP